MSNQQTSSNDPGHEQAESASSSSSQGHASTLMLLMRRLTPAPFSLGNVVATPGAIDLLDTCGMHANEILSRHQRGDWGVVCREDAEQNKQALKHHHRLLSSYVIGLQQERIWLITEHDRSVTTILLPSEASTEVHAEAMSLNNIAAGDIDDNGTIDVFALSLTA